jgi:hypothetical protein
MDPWYQEPCLTPMLLHLRSSCFETQGAGWHRVLIEIGAGGDGIDIEFRYAQMCMFHRSYTCISSALQCCA